MYSIPSPKQDAAIGCCRFRAASLLFYLLTNTTKSVDKTTVIIDNAVPI